MKRTSIILAFSFAVSACSSDDDKSGGPSPSDAGPGMFGATCAEHAECDSGVCFEFGNGAKLCSLACSAPADCPSGAEGQKCNGKGYCAP